MHALASGHYCEENDSVVCHILASWQSRKRSLYPTLPRKRRPCKRYDSGSSEGDRPGNVQDMYRRIFFEALDLIICGIQTQPGYQVCCKLENLLLKAANNDEELQFVTEY